ELFVLHENTDEHGHDSVPDAETVQGQKTEPTREPVAWEHHLVNPVPERIPHDDNSVDKVLLKGTANLPPETSRLPAILGEAFRVLRPGGELFIHGLGGNIPLNQ